MVMTDYIISEDLKDTLIGLLILLQKNSEKTYHKYSDSYTNRLLLADGKELKLPFLAEIQSDLEKLQPILTDDEYDSRIEELLLITQEMKLL